MNSAAVSLLKGKFSDGRLIISDDSDGRKVRWTLFNISEDHYTAKQDVSIDGGETWVEEAVVHEFDRAPLICSLCPGLP